MDDFLLDNVRRRPKPASKPTAAPVTPAGEKFDKFLAGAIVELKGEPPPTSTKERPMAGGKFFALLDEESSSDARLDELAEGLLRRRAALEERATRAIDTKHNRLGAAEAYLDRFEGKVKELEDSNKAAGNGGPTVEGSGELPKPSNAAADGSDK